MGKPFLRKIFVLFAFHLLWGVVLLVSVSKYGLGVSSDAVEYMFAGLNLTRGLGLVNYQLSPVLLWPPLYPALLALVHWATGLDMLSSALVFQILAFLLLGWMSAWLFLRIFPDDFWLAGAGLFMLDTSPVVLSSIQGVGTDYLFLALVTTFAVLTSLYIDRPTPRRYFILALMGTFAPLLRLVGVCIPTVGMFTAWLTGGGTLWQRFRRGAWLGLTALPAVVWVLLTWQITNADADRGPLTFWEDFERFSHGIVNWFVSMEAIKTRPLWYLLLLWAILGGLVLFLLVAGRRWRILNRYTLPVMALGLTYLIFLFTSARLKYVNRLVGRFTLPIYIPLILLVLLTIYALLLYIRRYGNKSAYFAVLAVSLVLLVYINTPFVKQTTQVLVDAYLHGVPSSSNSFNAEANNQNTIVQFWKLHPPEKDYLIFANSPEYFAFQTWELVRASPRKYSGPYDTDFRPLQSYHAGLFEPGKVTYLVWLGEDTREYIYTPDELRQDFHLETIVENEDGGIYIMTPR